MIDSVPALEGGFDSVSGLQERFINRIDYETCKDLYDGDIVDCSVSVAW
jgi:hypothetical protein